jgi:hypothetical protein
MATQKQIDANRRNAARSTGPNTEAGKAVTRYNGVTHGCRSKELDPLPDEAGAAFDANLDAWRADYSPTNETEARLVRQGAILSWKLDHAERQEAVLLARRVRAAVARAEQDRRDRVNDALDRLLPRKADVKKSGCDGQSASTLLETIEGTAEGCRELIYQWQRMRDVLRHGPYWDPEYEMHAIRLLGGGAGRISDPAVLDLVVANRALMLSSEVLDEPFFRLEGPLGLTLDQDAAREACLRWREDPAITTAALTATADRALARLREVLAIRERDGDLGAEEIAEAAELADLDPGPEVERLRRYQAVMQRQYIKTVETIPKLRLQELKLAEKRAKLGEFGATEANLTAPEEGDGDCPNLPRPRTSDEDEGESWEMGLSPSPGTTDVEKRATEANLAPQIRFTFTPERESAVVPVPPASRKESRRARKSREKALRRRLGKA